MRLFCVCCFFRRKLLSKLCLAGGSMRVQIRRSSAIQEEECSRGQSIQWHCKLDENLGSRWTRQEDVFFLWVIVGPGSNFYRKLCCLSTFTVESVERIIYSILFHDLFISLQTRICAAQGHLGGHLWFRNSARCTWQMSAASTAVLTWPAGCEVPPGLGEYTEQSDPPKETQIGQTNRKKEKEYRKILYDTL